MIGYDEWKADDEYSNKLPVELATDLKLVSGNVLVFELLKFKYY
jgi:hypothetical protein